MTDKFNAFMMTESDGVKKASLTQLTEADLPDQEVLIKISYSGLNYKDGLAICGKGIARHFPMVGGIDLVGSVIDGGQTEYAAGDKVIVNGWGLSEVHWGGFSQKPVSYTHLTLPTRIRV